MANNEEDNFLLQYVYSEAFKNLRRFIENEFPYYDCLNILYTKKVIDEECLRNINNAKNIAREREIFVDHLRTKNTVEVYGQFLNICDTKEPALANKIKEEILKEMSRKGLDHESHPLTMNDIKPGDQMSKSNNSTEESLTLLAYAEAFSSVRIFIEMKFDFQNDVGDLKKMNIIDKKCNDDITNAQDREQQANILLRYLTEKNEMKRYDEFIEYVMAKNKALANNINDAIAYKKKRFGLTSAKREHKRFQKPIGEGNTGKEGV